MNKLINFCKISTFAIVVFSMVSCTAEKESSKEIGIQLYSVRDDMKKDPESSVKKIGKMGYAFVEAAGYADGKFYGMEPAAFTALVESSNMNFLSSHTGRDLPDSTNWEETMAWWDASIAAHKDAGVKYIVQPWMGKAGYASLEGLKKYCDYFNAVGEKCRAQGIQFGYHNHANEFKELEGERIYDFMLANTDPEKVFFQLDLYWIMEGGQDAVDYFKKYPGRFKLWHVKDEKELGESGKMNFKPIFENSEVAEVEHIIVEVEQYNFEPMVSVQKSIEYLQNSDFVN
jgi:sugar phosphate isomerase/epimerase